jgi:hypothetical protein
MELSEPADFELPPRAEPKEYKPAETWDGLEHIGHLGDWRDIEPTEGDYFQSYE